MKIASKLPNVGTTIFAVMSKLATETGAINLGQGFPDFPLDEKLTLLVNKAMREGHNQYAPMPGVPVLCEALTNKVHRLYGAKYNATTEVTITAGGTQAIFTALAAVITAGDEVIIIDPAYDCYAPTVELFGGIAVHIPLDDQMRFQVGALAKAITKKTRLLMINTPHNPGGRILRDADMQAITMLLQNTDILLLSDEVYEHIIFDDEPHASSMNYAGLRDRTFAVFSFGKVFHATGWKMGYVFAPAHLMNEFRKVHQFNVFSVNRPVQHALAEYLKEPDHYTSIAAMYQKKRDRFQQGLSASKFNLLPCEGSYFQVADYSGISDLGDLEFAKWLTTEHGVASIPLSPFYKDPPEGQRLVRFCFAKVDETLIAATEKLCRI